VFKSPKMKFMEINEIDGLWSAGQLIFFQTELGPTHTAPIKLEDVASHFFTFKTLVLATILKSGH
jgi:hypothetical protein